MDLRKTELGVAVRGAGPGGADLPIRHIIGIGRNYPEHAKEQGASVPQRPMVFTKNPMAAARNGDDIRVPKICQDREQVDFEGELAVVIGRAARDVSAERALEFVLGYCVANDVSARWWQKEGSGGEFCRGKSFDTFCPLGPGVIPAAEIPDPQRLRITTKLNDATMQDASTGEMYFSVRTLVSELSKGTTLLPGTAILTGTPGGVGMARTPPVWLKHGDTVEIEIERVGVLRNRVVFEQ